MTLHEAEHSERARSHNKQTETKRQREQRLAQAKAERLRLRQRLAEDADCVWTFKEWCSLNSISPRQGRRILKGGGGPLVTMLTDTRIGISRRHDREWKAARVRGRR
jgi:hypothetical protein